VKVTSWLGVAARLVTGGVWVAAGVLKIGDPPENVRAVRAYDLLPESVVPVVGHALPVVEIVVGLCLVVGLVTRWAAVVSALLLVAFIIGISSAWARGMSIECGCFGGGGGPVQGASDKYPWGLARDVGLLLLSTYLIWRPRTPISVDNYVLPALPPPPAARTLAPTGGGRRGDRTRASQQAAEIRRLAAAEEQRKRNSVVTIVILTALLAVVGVGYAVQSSRDISGNKALFPRNVVAGYAMPYGKSSSPVTVDVYEDFMCPFCGAFEHASRDLVKKYAGRVAFRYHIISFLDRSSSNHYSTRAANALGVVLDAAGPKVAKRFHDELYSNQPSEGSAGLADSQLVNFAVSAGAKEADVQAGIDELRYRQWVANATDVASRNGVSGTPTIFVNGQKLPPSSTDQTVTDLKNAIERALNQ